MIVNHFPLDSHRSLFPDGFPPSYVFVATLRYKGSVAVEKWDLWRIQTHDGDPQMAVTLNGLDNTVMFTTTSNTPNAIQTVTFSQQTARVSFHCFYSEMTSQFDLKALENLLQKKKSRDWHSFNRW